MTAEPGARHPRADDDGRHQHRPDQRENLADERDAASEASEALTAARETAHADRKLHEQLILAHATERDDEADARDIVADKRDEAVSRNAFLADQKDYGPALEARRSAAVDRMLSKTDRTASAQDRANLTEEEPSS